MLPCRRKQGCCDWEAFLISFMCSDGQIQVRNCRIKELNKIQTWGGRGDGMGSGDGGGYSQFRNMAIFFLPFFLCVLTLRFFFGFLLFFGKFCHRFMGVELPAPGFLHVSHPALPFPRAGVLQMETSAFCWKLRWIKGTAGSSTAHCSYYSIMVQSLYFFPRLSAWLLIRGAIIHWGKV